MADTLREMPTDADIDMLRDRYGIKADGLEKPEKWGEGLVWEELHHKTRYPVFRRLNKASRHTFCPISHDRKQ